MYISPPPTKHVAFEGVELELYCDIPQQRNRRQSAIQSVIGATREGSQAVSESGNLKPSVVAMGKLGAVPID